VSYIRKRIEKWFENLTGLIYENRLKTLALMACLVGIFISQIPKITIDTSTEGFLHEDDPTLVSYNAFRDQFGRDEVIIVALKPPDVFDRTFLTQLKALHRELEDSVPYIDDITSLVNARNTRGQGDELIVEDLMERWPGTDALMATLKQRVHSNAMYRNLLISEDGRFTTIVIRTHSLSSTGQKTDVLEGFGDDIEIQTQAEKTEDAKPAYLTDAENSEAVVAVKRIIKKYETPDLEIFIAGSPVVTHFLKQAMMKDMRKFMALALVTIAILLFIMFRRISGVLFPLLVVLSTLLSTIGIMAMAGAAIKVPTQILPSFLMAVCVGASVHVLAIFYHRLRTSPDKKQAITYALGHSGLAIVMTSVTTASGLLSFARAEVAPIADIGIFAGIGVLLSLLYTLVMLPALVALFPIKAKPIETSGISRSPLSDRLLTWIAGISTTRPYAVLGVSGIIMIASVAGASAIRFSHNPLIWFPKDNEIRIATEEIDRELRGSMSLEVVIDTGRENGLYDPALLNRIEEASAYAETMTFDGLFAGKAWSLTTIIKEIHQALNENRQAYYTIPDKKDLVAQEFLLFENSGSDDLEDFVDSRFSKARLIIKAPFDDAVKYGKFLAMGETYFKKQLPDVDITLTGMMTLLSRTLSNAIMSLAKSYVTALCVITVLMVLLIGRVRIGLLSMIPNLAPILLTLGIMGALSIPMDLFTMMVGSIAIGLAVDDTIHFMHNFRRYYEESGDPVRAVHNTMQTTGRAMLVTSIVLSIGFFIFTFASMNNLFNFGILTAFTITMALLSDYFIAPALMVAINKKMERKHPDVEAESSGNP